MTTIAVSKKTKGKLKKLKEAFKVKSYNKLLEILAKKVKMEKMEKAWEFLSLKEKEAKEIEKVLEERREGWWKRSY